MKPAVKFITLSAARLSNKESLDTAIREGAGTGRQEPGRRSGTDRVGEPSHCS